MMRLWSRNSQTEPQGLTLEQWLHRPRGDLTRVTGIRVWWTILLIDLRVMRTRLKVILHNRWGLLRQHPISRRISQHLIGRQ